MKVSYFTLLKWCFTFLCAIIFCNLNGVVYLTMRLRAPFSPLILLLCFCILFLSVVKLKIKFTSNLYTLLLIFFFLYLVIGFGNYLLFPELVDPKTSVSKLLRTYIPSIVIISTFYIGTKAMLQYRLQNFLFRIILFFTFFSALFVILAPMIGLTEIYNSVRVIAINPERMTGLFANPNEAGAFGVYFLVIVLSAYGYFKKGAWLLIGLIPLALYVIFISFSRAALIMAVFILATYVIYNMTYIRRMRLSNSFKPLLMTFIFLIGTAVVSQQFFVYVQGLSYSQRSRLLQTFQLASGNISKTTTSERSNLFSFAWNKIKKRPFTGYGLGVFHRMTDFPGLNKMGVHNTHLLIWGEAGVLAFLAFCLFYILLGYAGWTHHYPSYGFLVLGITLAYFINVAGAGHNSLDDRTSNALIGIAIALSQVTSLRKAKVPAAKFEAN